MQLSQAMKYTRKKTQKISEKAGEAISKRLIESWDKAKGLRKDLKKEFSRVHRGTKRSKIPKKRRMRKRNNQ